MRTTEFYNTGTELDETALTSSGFVQASAFKVITVPVGKRARLVAACGSWAVVGAAQVVQLVVVLAAGNFQFRFPCTTVVDNGNTDEGFFVAGINCGQSISTADAIVTTLTDTNTLSIGLPADLWWRDTIRVATVFSLTAAAGGDWATGTDPLADGTSTVYAVEFEDSPIPSTARRTARQRQLAAV